MNGRRSSVSDYPEHLNPFYEGGDKWPFWGKVKRSGSFSNSLKDLRNTITLRSFRGHKKPKYEKDSDVQLRNQTYNGYSTVSRQTLPVYRQAHIVTSTPLLPRSRFSERVRKSVDNSYDSSKNPFENGDDDEEVNEIKPEDYRKRVRRRKRRAPLPPGVKDSSWSLTSVETDISSYPHSDVSDLDVSEIEKPMAEICEMLQSFTKEIEKMTDSFNGNVEEEPQRDEKEGTSDNENIACPKIVITAAEHTPTEDNILIIESVSYTTQDEDYGIEQKPSKEYSEVAAGKGCEKLGNVEENTNNSNSSRISETGCDRQIIEEEPPPSNQMINEKSPPSHHNQEIIKEKMVENGPSPSRHDHEVSKDRDCEIIDEKLSSSEKIEENLSSLGCDQETTEEKGCNQTKDENKRSSLGCDQVIVEEKQSSPGYDHEKAEEESYDQTKVEKKQSSLGCDQDKVEEKPSSSGYDHKAAEEESYDQTKVEKKQSSLGCDQDKVEKKPSSSGYDHKAAEEESYDQTKVEKKQSSLGCDQDQVEGKPSSSSCDHETTEEKGCDQITVEKRRSSSGCDKDKIEEKPSSSGCAHKIIVEEEAQTKEVEQKAHNLNNNNYHIESNSEGLGVSHFSRYAHDLKYIDESYTIHDRVMDDSDIRNDNSQKVDETNNNKGYIPNGSYKESKFPVEESDFANGNGTNTNKKVIEEKEIQEQPPIPKVRKKKFTKAKLLGFFSGK